MASKLEIILDVLLSRQSKANVDKLNKSLKETGTAGQTAEQKLGGFLKKTASMAGIALTAGTAVMVLGKFLKDSVEAAAEAESVQAKLNSVLDATGESAGMSADQLNRLADRLSYMAGVDDEAIVGAETLMLTFTKIGSETFPRAMEAAMDMSTVLKTDLPSAVTVLGKALQDPVEGLTALQRLGIRFTDAEKDMIQAMLDAGKVAEAQGVILDKLEGKYKGAAEAAGKTYAGQVARLQVAWENFSELIGQNVIPILTDLLSIWNAFIETNDLATEAIERGIISQDELTDKMRESGDGVAGYNKVIGWLRDKLEAADKAAYNAADSVERIRLKSKEAIPTIDDLAESTEGTIVPAEKAKVAFDAWADGLNSNLTSAIENAMENIDWLLSGGAELQTKFEEINKALTLGQITKEQARKFFENLYVEATMIELEIGKIDVEQAAEQIAEQLGVSIAMANLIIKSAEPAIIPIKVELEQPIDELYQQQLNSFIITDADAEAMMSPLKTEIEEVTAKIDALTLDRDFNLEMGINEPLIDESMVKMDDLSRNRTFNLTMVANKSYMQEILNLVNAIDQDRSFTITANYATTGAPPGYQHGGSFTVPPGYRNDSFLMGVTSGEHVRVTPAGGGGVYASGSRMGGGNSVVINYSPMFSLTDREHVETELVPIIQKAIRRYG